MDTNRLNQFLKSTKALNSGNQAHLPFQAEENLESIEARRSHLGLTTGQFFPHLYGLSAVNDAVFLNGNIENYIGQTIIPTGVIGPVQVHGTAANGTYFVPLATTEGALVASYHRGARAALESGGITSLSVSKKVQRCPSFQFQSVADAAAFYVEIEQYTHADFQKLASEKSSRAVLVGTNYTLEGRQLILTLEFETADAAGQNIVTVCSEHISSYLVEQAITKPDVWYLESNLNGDKKANAKTLSSVRGQRVIAEAKLPQAVIQKVLKADGAAMARYYLNSSIATTMSGSLGMQGHFANGLTALFIATGQDAACVAEAAIGITRLEYSEEKQELYASVTLPNLICGTVGGGTGLPTQKEALSMMDCLGTGMAVRFAEIAAAVVLCGELSIIAALSAGHFGKAHARFRPKLSNS